MKLTDVDQIKALLARHGFRFSKSKGQNFLIADWVPRRIAESAALDGDAAVLEIGPGLGCLTAELAERAGKVLAVELDRSLAPVLAETLAGRENVELLFGDVLRQDLDALYRERLAPRRAVVCANLPYNISSPAITALLKCGAFESMTLMVQRELAQRICAGAGEADYGAFSLLVQWYARPEILFTVPPDCFIPRPKVSSAVIRLQRRETPPAPVTDEALLFRLIRAAFAQRRKTLLNAMAAGLPELSKAEAAALLEKLGFDTRIRGESLDIGEFAKIANEIAKFGLADL